MPRVSPTLSLWALWACSARPEAPVTASEAPSEAPAAPAVAAPPSGEGAEVALPPGDLNASSRADAATRPLVPVDTRHVWTLRPLSDAERAAMIGVSWKEGCPVPLDDLRRVELSHWTPEGGQAIGALVLHKDVTSVVISAFGTAWQARFPIARMEPIEAFGGDDDASMRANNTSAFNCRKTEGTDAWSKHSWGTAIDVNPLWNPWVRKDAAGGAEVSPEAGRPWADRQNVRPGMLTGADPLTTAFKQLGWGWGGDWSRSKDYQHLSRDGK